MTPYPWGMRSQWGSYPDQNLKTIVQILARFPCLLLPNQIGYKDGGVAAREAVGVAGRVAVKRHGQGCPMVSHNHQVNHKTLQIFQTSVIVTDQFSENVLKCQ